MTVTFGPEVENLTAMPTVWMPEEGVRRATRGGGLPRHGGSGFEYVKVTSYAEAVAALVEHGDGARIIAGGQSLVPMMNLRLVRPTVLIDVNGIAPERPYLDCDQLVLPAMTRYSEVLASPMVRSHSPLLASAVTHVGNVRVRNRGTIGGSLAHGQSTAEIAVVALALGGEITAYGPAGSRVIRSEDFFLGYLTTSLEPEEVVTALRLPVAGRRRGWSFHELARRSGCPAIVGVAATVELEPGADLVTGLKVGLLGVADRPVIGAPSATSRLIGQVPSAAQLDSVACAVGAATCPMDDAQASGTYRRRLVRVLTRRALTEALLGAGGRVAAA
jgi:CO/xanthine dehydrogenase FAD-binding subunit